PKVGRNNWLVRLFAILAQRRPTVVAHSGGESHQDPQFIEQFVTEEKMGRRGEAIAAFARGVRVCFCQLFFVVHVTVPCLAAVLPTSVLRDRTCKSLLASSMSHKQHRAHRRL